MNHPENCSLCNQEEENIDHLLVSCVFARQFWFNFLQRVHLQDLTPQMDTISFSEWWRKANERVLGSGKKGLNSLVILGAWPLWKHHNRCVFGGASPNLATALCQAEEERVVWDLAEAKGITFLMAQLQGE
jgi:hypothetical protein